MPNYHKQTIELILDKDTDLYRRIEIAASREGKPVEYIIDGIAGVGIAHFMSDNLKFFYERQITQKTF